MPDGKLPLRGRQHRQFGTAGAGIRPAVSLVRSSSYLDSIPDVVEEEVAVEVPLLRSVIRIFSTLKHIRQIRRVLASLERQLNPGGVLAGCVYPHNICLPVIVRFFPFSGWAANPEEIRFVK